MNTRQWMIENVQSYSSVVDLIYATIVQFNLDETTSRVWDDGEQLWEYHQQTQSETKYG